MDSSRSQTFDDQLFTPVPSPLKVISPKSSPKTGDKSSQDSRGISSSVTVLRPRSPTKCSTGERGLMEFVERGIKDGFNSGVPCPWEDIICAFSATFLFRSLSGSFIPDVDMHMYWCNFCPFKTKEKREMITHSMSHRFKCNYCDEECFTRSDVVKHSIRKHPEYKLTRHALKACMLLRDLLEQDETSIMFGGKNIDSDDKSENFHLDYPQQSNNSDHGSSNSGGEFLNLTSNFLRNQNSHTPMKIADTYSMFPSSKKDTNDNSNEEEMTTLPLEISNMRSLVNMTPSMAESNSNESSVKFIDLTSAEGHKQNTSTKQTASITNVQSDVESSRNDGNAIQNLISSTDETDLQIVDVQSANTFNASALTTNSADGNDVQSFDNSIQPPVSQQNPATETLQLLESLNPDKASEKTKEMPDVSEETMGEKESRESLSDKESEEAVGDKESGEAHKRKVAELNLDSSELEDEDDDPDYQPEKATKAERIVRKKKKKERKLSHKELPVKKKSVLEDNFNVDDLPVGLPFFRCGYCQYRTLKEKRVEVHQSQKHPSKPSRYTRLIVNSNREVLQDTNKHSSQKSNEIKPSTSSSSSSSPAPAKTDSHDNDDGEKEVKDKYACMFCTFKSANVQIIRQHMFRLHPSKKFCCIDNVLKQQSKNFYTFFCCRHKCNFLSIEPQKYIEHVEKCTPLPKTEIEDSSKPTGLQQTVTFAQSLQDADGNRGTKELSTARNYSCHRCSFSAVGNEAMKKHMLSEHPKLHMIALVKKPNAALEFYLFCPDENCKFITQEKHELDTHTKQNHTTKSAPFNDEDFDIKPFGDQTDGEPIEKNTITYMPAYECLYCETSCISTSLMNMKRHVQETHPQEVIIVRDCVAYKRKRPSRIYVCDTEGCIFNDLDYKEYLTHVVAHKGGTIYGCANCNWAGQEKKDFTDHMKRQKGIKHSLVETAVVMNDDGTIVKTIL